ncbi:MAG: hypothetical protein OHK0011_05890 [Turneriella sp.]
MNYPIKVKKAFNRVRYQVHDAWQNLRLLKRNISYLVRSIDDVGNRVHRSRQLLQGIALPEGCPGSVQAERGVQGGGYS